jgi:hypothetical protein
MSIIAIRQALETHLATLTPALATAYENKDYVPVTGTPYQRVNLMPAQPDNSTMGQTFYREQGIFQVMLCYPNNQTTLAVQTRAEAIRTLFKRGTTLEQSGLKVHIINTPKIGIGFHDQDRYCIPITIYYLVDIYL